MPDIKTIHDEIRARLAEIEELIEPLRSEARQLMELAAVFGDDRPRGSASKRRPAPARRSPPTGAPSSAAGTKRGRPPGSGNRARQALARIAERPGLTATELAEAMGIATNYLYRVLPRLEKEGRITKRGRGYHLAGGSETH